MNILVVYDSAYGNTAKVAEAIGDSLKSFGNVTSAPIGDITAKDLLHQDFLFIGSPTQGGRPTKPTIQFIAELPKEVIDTAKLAVFDTRFEITEQKKALQLLMKVIGYAAPKMAASLKQKGCTVVSTPQGFIVADKEGPIRDGEIDRATQWARKVVETN